VIDTLAEAYEVTSGLFKTRGSNWAIWLLDVWPL